MGKENLAVLLCDTTLDAPSSASDRPLTALGEEYRAFGLLGQLADFSGRSRWCEQQYIQVSWGNVHVCSWFIVIAFPVPGPVRS